MRYSVNYSNMTYVKDYLIIFCRLIKDISLNWIWLLSLYFGEQFEREYHDFRAKANFVIFFENI